MIKQEQNSKKIYDIFIIGGGINGCGIARDAAGRGLSVGLAEMNDLGSGTSSASTKLFHGGLRYLEHYEFRLVRESLIEREILLNMMPHISWPMRFILPHHKELRPIWLLKLGLFIYDHLGGRKILPPTTYINFKRDAAGIPLKETFNKGFEYSDCWVQDSRLVILNARDAEKKGANIFPYTKVTNATVNNNHWHITIKNQYGKEKTLIAKSLINAGGPWVNDIIHHTIKKNKTHNIRLVRGSHIVTKKLYSHDKCYIFQGNDKRIIFSIPYEEDFTLIGTTDVTHDATKDKIECNEEEKEYLCNFANQYLKEPITKKDIIWSYSGVRPLYDDNQSNISKVTRDYFLDLYYDNDTPPLLNIFGGKITTYRKLAESALDKLKFLFPHMNSCWTEKSHLSGGNFSIDDKEKLTNELQHHYSFLTEKTARRFMNNYGLDSYNILENAMILPDLGIIFGADLSEAEVKWLVKYEYAKTAEDIIWRRTKCGLHFTKEQIKHLEEYLYHHHQETL